MGLETSAIRYYERIGLLPAPQRAGGQRQYDESVLQNLAVIQRARRLGFSLDEIKQLFFGFKNGVPASRRWHKLSRKKLTEIENLIRETKVMKRLLQKMMTNCHCLTFEQCGRGILHSDFSRPMPAPIRRLKRI